MVQFSADYSHELYGSLYKNIGGKGLFIPPPFFHSTISVSGISITFSSSSAIMAQKSHQNNKAINTIAATFLQVLSIVLFIWSSYLFLKPSNLHKCSSFSNILTNSTIKFLKVILKFCHSNRKRLSLCHQINIYTLWATINVLPFC